MYISISPKMSLTPFWSSPLVMTCKFSQFAHHWQINKWIEKLDSGCTFLLCHHWIRPLHFNNCLVQLSYQIWPQKTTEGSPDCWANHWYNPPHSPRTVLIQSEQRAGKITLDPSHPAHSRFELLPSGRRYRALSTRTTRHRNSFFPQAIHLMNTWQ